MDENITHRFVLTQYLKALGFHPVEACDGKGALTILKKSISSKNLFDLIITDFQILGMSGFDLVKDVRKVQTLKRIPIIVFTPVDNRGDGKFFVDMGIDGYLTKPVNLNDLQKSIETIMGLAKAEDPSAEIIQSQPASLTDEQRKAFHILLVEDYITNQQVALGHLKNAGYSTDLAENGREALEAYKLSHYDLILMDIQMPEMDGFEATRKIREIENRYRINHSEDLIKKRVPIIAMTAHAIKGYKERCLAEGMDDYIAKPITKIELLTLVDRWLMLQRPPIIRKSYSKSIRNTDDFAEKIVQESFTSDPIQQSGLPDPIHLERALKEFENDKDFLTLVIDGFMEKVKAQTVIIRQAIADDDAECVRKEAHAMKGGAANLTADHLAGIAFELEKVGKSGSLGGGMDLVEKVEKECGRLKAFVKWL